MLPLHLLFPRRISLCNAVLAGEAVELGLTVSATEGTGGNKANDEASALDRC